MALCAFSTMAQQDHFVYLQTDNGNPFYVRINTKILSSSSEGYIIIPNVTSGVYQLQVGFPKKEYPEQTFTISVDKNNEGYLIKHFEDKGLQLFNMETLALISGDKDTAPTTAVVTHDNNPFTKMLADVVKDSSILQNHELAIENPAKMPDNSDSANSMAVKEIPPADTTSVAGMAAIPADSASAPNTTAVVSSLPPSDSSSVAVTSDSQVSKLLSAKNEKGLQMIYADRNGSDKDTVRVFMPLANREIPDESKATNNDNFNLPENKKEVYASNDTSLTITPTIIKPENEKKGFVMRKDDLASATDSASVNKTAPEQVFYIGPKDKNKERPEEKPTDEKKGLFSGLNPSKSPDTERGNTEKKPVNKIEVLPKVVTSSEVNSDCKEFADNEDFLRLRKKMASEDNKEDMLKVARKSFRTRCFSTAQIKDLSFLFLTDEGKYMFFDAAYPHTSDSDQFNSLEAQLKDPYYKTRFEAMIRH